MNANQKKQLTWAIIGLAFLGFLAMKNNVIPSAPQASYAPDPQSETPGMIQWNR